MSKSYLTPAQVEVLLRPVNPSRVETLPSKGGGKGMSYLAQHDVRAHMNRIFGFGRWSTRVVETAFIFEEQDSNSRWKAGYRATVRVEVYSPDGTFLAAYEDSHASGNAPQPDRSEAHALALTSAVSTAFKRACTNLGDQFGLSLYAQGSREAIVKGTVMVYDYDGDMAGAADGPDGPDTLPEPGTGTREAEEAESLRASLDAIAAEHTEPGDRIMAVAAFKSLVDDTWLSVLIPSVGITVGAYADRVATGQKGS